MRMFLALALSGCLATSLDDPPPMDPGNPGDPGTPGDPGSPGTPTGGFALASSDHGLAYLANVVIGGQTFALDVDTGSTTLAVAGSTCTTCAVTPEWTPDARAQDQGQTATSTYGDMSSWSGENYKDDVSLPGDGKVSMRFSSITTQSMFFVSGSQGIIGFDLPANAVAGTDSYVDKRAAAGMVSSFAFQFCEDSGYLWFGDFDPSVASGPAVYTPLHASSTNPFYGLDVSDAKVGTTSVGLTGAAIADTGTTLMIVSPAVETATINAVTASSGFKQLFAGQTLSEQSCLDPGTHTRAEIDAALPAFTVTLPTTDGGNAKLTATASQSYLFHYQGGYCLGMASVSGLPTILGDTFLRNFISVFDRTGNRLGFAPQSSCKNPPAHAGTPQLTPPHWVVRGQQR